jgi:hypothetical protein
MRYIGRDANAVPKAARYSLQISGAISPLSFRLLYITGAGKYSIDVLCSIAAP